MAEKMTLKIEGMGCSKCVDKVEKALGDIDGISEIEVSLDNNAASFALAAPATRESAVEAIEDVGYDVAG
ncbi:copper ion binding protein [Martelella mangrovi]|uniref:Copper ion binding protein n=1 Tax=Martelella mangrovi TaxID=1397477 RepID=A0ABV2IGL8_9HYPH